VLFKDTDFFLCGQIDALFVCMSMKDRVHNLTVGLSVCVRMTHLERGGRQVDRLA